jgi:hypothetical protein
MSQNLLFAVSTISRLMSINPYASPTVASIAPPGPASGLSLNGVWVDGKALVVPPGAVLPRRCVKTNEPISEKDMAAKTFTWCPRWVIIVFLFSRLLGFIVYFIARHTFKVTYGIHPDVRRKRRNRMLISGLVCVTCIALIPVTAMLDQPEIPVALCFGGVIVSSVILMLLAGQLSVKTHKKGAYWIVGCSPEFLLSIPQEAALELERYKQKGARPCPSCGILFMAPPGTPWADKGYCSRSCLIAVEGETAANPTTDSPFITATLGHGIQTRCPVGHTFRVPTSFAGTTRPCPVCGEKSRVP